MNPDPVVDSRAFISLCMIVKNESAHLSRCLASVQPFVDEMIVVDTGSEDDTVAIARRFGATVSQFDWCDDFSAARNYSLAQATGEWILVVDADEELIIQSEQFRQELHTIPDAVLQCNLKRLEVPHETVGMPKVTPIYTARLFRNQPELRYVFPYHEQLYYQGAPLNPSQVVLFPGLELLHYGYAPELLQKKHLTRNIPLLEKARQKGEITLTLLITLANFHQKMGNLEQAQTCYAEAFERLFPYLIEGTPPPEFTFIPYLMHFLGTQALEQDDFETARLLGQRGLEWFPTHPPLNYLASHILNQLGFVKGAIAYLQYCLELGQNRSYYRSEPFDQAFMTLYPAHSLGCLYLNLQDGQQAKTFFELALSFDANFTDAQAGLATAEQMLAAALD
ncbi:MAG TPA: glycosyltransferase [Chroococcidiopsis sp.]